MFQSLFRYTVSALCYQIAGDEKPGAPPPYNDVVLFVTEQQGRMPQMLGAGVRLATVLFAVAAITRGGTVFHRLSPARRRLQVAAWTASRLGPCRDLMRLYSSLVMLALYSRPVGLHG